jgi:opacity protein-like surface antigen
MRPFTTTLLASLVISAAAAAQPTVMLEVRPTFAIPVGKLAGANLTMGPAFGITGSWRARETLHLYGGWDWAHFGAKSSFAGSNMDFEETGYVLGLRLERPCPRGHPMALRLETGATYKHVEVENSSGARAADSEHSVGYEVGAGVAFGLGDEWSLVPMARFRALSPEFTIGPASTAGNLRYATIEFTLSRRFR